MQHRLNRRRWWLALAAVVAALVAPAQAQQAYPQQTITIIVAFAPGGVADTVARLVGQRLSERLGSNVVVENRGGAAGNLAAVQVAGAKPDGYTLLATTTAIAINDTVYKNKGYDTNALKAVAIAASTPEALAVAPQNPAKDLREFVKNAQGRTFTFATAGVGTGSYIAAQYFFKEIAKIDALHIPYPGGAPAATAILGNQVDLGAISLPSIAPQIRQGALRGIGIASSKRAPSVPDVPTYAEMGFPNFEASSWVGLFAPAKTPAAVFEKLSPAIAEILKEPEVQKRLRATGFEPMVMSQAEAADFFRDEVRKWGQMARTIGASVE